MPRSPTSVRISTTVLREMSLFENDGVHGKILDLAYNTLLSVIRDRITVKPVKQKIDPVIHALAATFFVSLLHVYIDCANKKPKQSIEPTFVECNWQSTHHVHIFIEQDFTNYGFPFGPAQLPGTQRKYCTHPSIC